MDFNVKVDNNSPGQFLVSVNQSVVGIMSYHQASKTGWYEDEDRGHVALMFDVEYNDMVDSIRKYYVK